MDEETQKVMVETSNLETAELCKRLYAMPKIPSPVFADVLRMIAVRLLSFSHEAVKEHAGNEQAKLFIDSFAMELSLHTGLTIHISRPEGRQ